MRTDWRAQLWTLLPWGALLRKHRARLLRLRDRLRLSEEAFHLIVAGAVGIVGGLVNIGLYYAAELAKIVVFAESGPWVELAAGRSPLFRLGLPCLGAAMAGLTLHWAARSVRFQDTGNILEVVVAGDGRMRFRGALAKAVASLLSISTGGSIGREGPITHLSAAIASRLGQFARWQPYRLRLLVACGCAAGLAAAYNAPVAGAVFAAQIVLGTFSMSLFAPLVFASVVATMVSRSFFGITPVYDVPAGVEFTGMAQLPWFIVLGLGSGALGAGFLRLLRESAERFESRITQLPLRLLLGGALVGLILVIRPEVWGNGYEPTSGILYDSYTLEMLVFLLVAKFAATVITVGSGAVGGVFTPTLFLGAALGGLFADVLHQLRLAGDLPTTAFALVGMGSLLAATTHSPLLAMILIFEISPNYSLMPPLMIACAISTLVARRLVREDIYTAPIRRRGFALDRESARLGVLTQKTIGDIMQSPVTPVRPNSMFRELTDRFLTSPLNYLPVVNAAGRLVGVVALQDLKEHLGVDSSLDPVIAFDIMRPPPPCLTPDQRLVDALPLLLSSDLRNVPVVNSRDQMRLIGAVIRPEALAQIAESLDVQSARGG